MMMSGVILSNSSFFAESFFALLMRSFFNPGLVLPPHTHHNSTKHNSFGVFIAICPEICCFSAFASASPPTPSCPRFFNNPRGTRHFTHHDGESITITCRHALAKENRQIENFNILLCSFRAIVLTTSKSM